MHINTYIHNYVHTYTYTHTHIYIYIPIFIHSFIMHSVNPCKVKQPMGYRTCHNINVFNIYINI
jgi:hypothetical protein